VPVDAATCALIDCTVTDEKVFPVHIQASLPAEHGTIINRSSTFELRYKLPSPCTPLECAHANDLKDLDASKGDKVPHDIQIDVEQNYNETDFSNFRDYKNSVCSGSTGTDPAGNA